MSVIFDPKSKACHAAEKRYGILSFLMLDELLPIKTFRYCKSAGFTLLEMLVVIGLIGIVALGSASMLIDNGDWKRQDETEKRWDAIRKAIIGEPNLSLNGSPYVAGYVADMGRLPLSISELIEKDVQFDDSGDGVDDTLCSFDHDNNAVTADINIQQPTFADIPIPNYTPDAGYTNTVSGGWRGPYLYTAGSSFYGDGWFNQITGDPCDFDWSIITTPQNPENLDDITDLRIQSLGSDRSLGGGESAQDYPASNLNMVNLNEWTLTTAPIDFNIRFNKPVTTPFTNLELRIYRYKDNGNNTQSFVEDVVEVPADTTFDLAANDLSAPTQTITPTENLPIGRFAAVIWCTDVIPEAVYDGDCDGGNIKHSPVYFTLTQNTTQVTLTWNIP